jgi:hypothetical protein
MPKTHLTAGGGSAYAAYSNPIYFIYDEGRNYVRTRHDTTNDTTRACVDVVGGVVGGAGSLTRQATLSIVVKIMDKIFRSVSSGISQKLLTTALGPILVPPPPNHYHYHHLFQSTPHQRATNQTTPTN